MHSAIRNLRNKASKLDGYDVASIALLAILVLLALLTFSAYAISNDEEVQQHYGELIVAYYQSGFTDQDLFHYINLYLYGGLFDIVAVALQHALPFFDPYSIRHVFCALTGIAGIGAAWATARLIAGPRAGVITAIALAVCGPWYGSMFNHTKDIPFAAAMMGATYFLIRVARDLPKPRLAEVIAFGLTLGAALGIRVLGLLLIGYVALAILLHMPRPRIATLRAQIDFFARSAAAFWPAFLIGYVIMIVAWPWSALSPLNPVRGLIDFGEFHYDIQTILAGKVYEMGNVPRWYVPDYLAIKLPLIILAGAAIALAFVIWPGRGDKNRKPSSQRRSETVFLIFVAIFPVLCEVIDRGPAFTGMRHFLFVAPTLAVLAGIGFDRLIAQLARQRNLLAPAAATALGAALLWNASVLMRLHPYEYLYYNPLVGGLEGASGRYATDYWVNIMPEAVGDLESYIDRLDKFGGHHQPYTVAVCGERLPFEKRADKRMKWVEDWNKAEFFIAPTHMDCDRALDGSVIATISRMGARIGVVKDRRALMQSEVAHRH